MKLKIILFFAIIVSSTACSQKTCPTYTLEDTATEVSAEKV